jgi:hypothetical protein
LIRISSGEETTIITGRGWARTLNRNRAVKIKVFSSTVVYAPKQITNKTAGKIEGSPAARALHLMLTGQVF